jgi:hypothetical protein
MRQRSAYWHRSATDGRSASTAPYRIEARRDESSRRGARDRCRIERELGAGGMATVYLAEDLKQLRAAPRSIRTLAPPLECGRADPHGGIGAGRGRRGRRGRRLLQARGSVRHRDHDLTRLIRPNEQ